MTNTTQELRDIARDMRMYAELVLAAVEQVEDISKMPVFEPATVSGVLGSLTDDKNSLESELDRLQTYLEGLTDGTDN